MSEVKATTLATEVAAQHGTTRQVAFDAILATATELEITGTRYTAKQAAEIEAILARTTTLPTLTRHEI